LAAAFAQQQQQQHGGREMLAQKKRSSRSRLDPFCPSRIASNAIYEISSAALESRARA
jgi:hypothetical protein